MSDVVLTVEVQTENLEAIQEAEKGIKDVGDSARKAAPGIDEAGKSLGDFMAKFDKARDILKGGSKDIQLSSKQIQKALDFAEGKVSLEKLTGATKKAADQTKAASKEMGVFGKSAEGVIKGLVGIATAYAGGRFLLGIAKDSIEAARGSDNLLAGLAKTKDAVASLEAVEKAVSDLKTSLGTELIIAAEPVTSGFAKRFQDAADGLRLMREQAALIDAGVISDMDARLFNLLGTEKDFEIALELVNQRLEENPELMEEIRGSAEGTETAVSDLTDGFLALANAQELFTPVDAAKLADLRTFEAVEEAARADEEALRDAEQAFDDFFDAIKQGLTGETLDILTGLQFEDLGGDEILEMQNAIKVAFEAGAITREQARELFGLQFIEEEALKVAQGLQTAFAAEGVIKDAADLFGFSPEEAKQFLEDALSGVDILADVDLQAAVAENLPEIETAASRLAEAMASAAGPIAVDIQDEPLVAAGKKADELLITLEKIGSQKFKTVVDVIVKITEAGAGPGLQHGGDFVVPPGFENDSFPIRVSSGERVQVTPPGGNTTTNRSTIFGDVFTETLDLAALATAKEDEDFLR